MRVLITAAMCCTPSMVLAQPCWDVVTPSHVLISPQGAEDGFGTGGFFSERPNMIVQGNVAVVGNFQADGFTGQVFIYTFDGQQWNLIQTLAPTEYAWFGRELDMDGTTLVVSAEQENVPGSDPLMPDGVVYVYEWDGNQFQFDTKLNPPPDDGVDGVLSRFGSLAISGNWVMAGKSDDFGYNHLFIFERTGQTWTLVQTVPDVKPENLVLDVPFAGWGANMDCLKLQGSTWQVQANGCAPGPGEGGVAIDGAGFANRYINGSWQQDTYQPFPTPVFPDMRIHENIANFWTVHAFGGQVWAPTGEMYHFTNGAAPGRSTTRWVMRVAGSGVIEMIDLTQTPPATPTIDTGQIIDNPAPDDNDFFGAAVAMGEDYAVIGVSGESPSQTPAGSAMVLARSGDTWVQDTLLMVPVQGFSYTGNTLDITGAGEQTVIAIGGSGYCAPGGIPANPGQAFVATRNVNATNGWQIEELVPTNPVQCNANPNVVWDGFDMSIKAAGSGNDAIIAVGYAGENSGLGVIEIFGRVNGVWQNIASLASGQTPGALSGKYMDVVAMEAGEYLLVVTENAGTKSSKYTSLDGGHSWGLFGNLWSSYGYGTHFTCFYDGTRPLLLTPTKLIHVKDGYTDVVLFNYDTGMQYIDSFDAVRGDDGIITVAIGANANASSPVKVMQLRPLHNIPTCVRELPIDLSVASAADGLGFATAVGLNQGTPVILAGVAYANGQNGNSTVYATGEAIMTIPAQPLSPPDRGDLNGDGHVSTDDLLMILGSWGTCRDTCRGDINQDGRVGVDDLLIVLRGWSG